MATLAQSIRIFSNSKYTVGIGGTISSDDLLTLQELVAGDLSRMNPGFEGADLIRLEAYLILDILSNTGGIGNIVEKKVNLVSWKVSRSTVKGSTSVWYDLAERMISEFGKTTMPAGVSRADAYVNGLDSTEIEQYGGPSDAPV